MRTAARIAMTGVLLASCTIEDRSPDGTRRDEEEIRAVVTGYYRGLADRDWPGARALFWDSALVSVGTAAGARSFPTPDAFGQHLAVLPAGTAGSPVRAVRIDARQEGDVAGAWAETRGSAPDGRQVPGPTDHFVLRRMDGVWRIITLTSAGAASRQQPKE